MKYIILIIFIIISSSIYSQCIGEGYILSYDSSEKSIIRRTTDLELVEGFITIFTKQTINLDQIFINSNYFDLKTGSFYLYCERKIVYKVKNKIVYKTVTKKRQKEFETLKLKQ